MKCECCGEEMTKAKESFFYVQPGGLFTVIFKYEHPDGGEVVEEFHDQSVEECINLFTELPEETAKEIRDGLNKAIKEMGA
jgi:hypothetical protein